MSREERTRAARAAEGFTILELLVGIAVLGILATLLIPKGVCQIRKAHVSSILEDISVARAEIELFELEHQRFPDDLEEAFGGKPVPDTLVYCVDIPDANAGHGNEECTFFDEDNPSGNNNHGGVPALGYLLRTHYNVAECANFDFAWTSCCGKEIDKIGFDDDFELPGHPGKGGGRGN